MKKSITVIFPLVLAFSQSMAFADDSEAYVRASSHYPATQQIEDAARQTKDGIEAMGTGDFWVSPGKDRDATVVAAEHGGASLALGIGSALSIQIQPWTQASGALSGIKDNHFMVSEDAYNSLIKEGIIKDPMYTFITVGAKFAIEVYDKNGKLLERDLTGGALRRPAIRKLLSGAGKWANKDGATFKITSENVILGKAARTVPIVLAAGAVDQLYQALTGKSLIGEAADASIEEIQSVFGKSGHSPIASHESQTVIPAAGVAAN